MNENISSVNKNFCHCHFKYFHLKSNNRIKLKLKHKQQEYFKMFKKTNSKVIFFNLSLNKKLF